MALSQTALQALLASATKEVFLECLTFEHSEMTTLRLVNDGVDLERSAGTFSRFPFMVKMPAQNTNSPPSIEIQADMVDQRVMLALRQLAGKRERVTITYEVVLAGTPNTIEYGPAEFELDSITTNAETSLSIQASFLAGSLNDAFPNLIFAPSNRES